MHTDSTLKIFDEITADIGAEFRTFERETCSVFDTRELPCEANARQRRKQKSKQGCLPAPAERGSLDGSATAEGRRPKKFNLQTYKYHSLGDYPDTIRQYGTSDSYSTEPVSMRT